MVKKKIKKKSSKKKEDASTQPVFSKQVGKEKAVKEGKKPVKKPEKVSNEGGKILRRELRDEKTIAMDFAEKVQKKFDRIVKASVLFGSQATAMAGSGSDSDIDIILIVDDAAIAWDLELVAWYREELAKLIAAQSYGKELHINTVRLTTWWNDLLHGDPVVINILRYGETLIDYGGFFNPIKSLLLQGKIKSTPEAVYSALRRVPGHISRSKMAEVSAIEGVYWAMVDASQAALMTAGKLPPSPQHIPDMLNETFVESKMLKGEYVKSMREIYALHKAIEHGGVSDIKGSDIDEWQELSESFLKEMTGIIDGLLEQE